MGPAYPLRGGIADFNQALAKELQASGHNVVIFSFSLQYPGFLFPGKTQFAEEEKDFNLEVRPVINSINPLNWVNSARKVWAFQPDLLIIRFWMPFMGPSLGTIAGKLRKKGVPVLAITDNIVPHEKRKGDKLLTRYFLKRCNAFMVMSKQVGNDLLEFIPDAKYRYNPHPVYNIFGETVDRELALQQLGLDSGYRYVLFFGLIRKYKGLDILIKGFARVADQLEHVKLLIAGEFYDDQQEYLELIKTLDLRNKILIHDHFIPNEQVKHYFCASSLLAQTYLSATQSGVAQIAYSFDLPILATRVGGLPEVVDHERTGYVVDTDPEAVGKAILDFFTADREDSMRKAMHEDAQRFEWSYFVDNLMDLYREVKG